MISLTIWQLIALFFAVSFVGWICEDISRGIAAKEFVNSGFLTGPICPIYGLGAGILILCANLTDGFISLEDNNIGMYFLVFFASMIILTLWELLVGLFLEKVFKTQYWDYSELKFNIGGRIALKNSIYWGLAGVAFFKFGKPFLQFVSTEILDKIPTMPLIYIDIILLSILIIDLIYNVTSMFTLEETIAKFKNLRELSIDDVKEKIRFTKYVQRIRKAFPSIKSKIPITKVKLETNLNILREKLANLQKKKGEDK